MKTKLTALTMVLLLSQGSVFACEVCKKNQPKGLENITHGVGPQGNIDYAITWVAIGIVAVTLYLSIKYLVKPNDGSRNEIKHLIVDEGKRNCAN